MDRREFFDEPLDKFRGVDPVRASKPLAKLIDVRDIGKHVGQDTILDRVDPGLLDRISDNRLPIDQIRIELGRQFGSFVFPRSWVGGVDSEGTLKILDRSIGVRRILKQRLASLHASRQIVRFVFRYPFSQQASGLGNTPFVLGVKDLEEKVFRSVGNKLFEGLRTLFTQGKAFEESWALPVKEESNSRKRPTRMRIGCISARKVGSKWVRSEFDEGWTSGPIPV